LRDLTIYRLESSAGRLKSAKLELDAGNFKDLINRSYYAIFHAIRALLAENEIGFKKHSAVIAYFRQHYIKTEIFDKKFSDYVGKAFTIRSFCDYADFFFVSREETETHYLQAVEFFETVKNYLENLNNDQ